MVFLLRFGGYFGLVSKYIAERADSMSTAGPIDREFSGIVVRAANRMDAISEIMRAVYDGEPHLFSFCNAATINYAHRSPEFAEALSNATLFNDGIGLDVASKILYNEFFPENLNGTDLIPALFRGFDREVSVFLLGSLPGVAERAGEVIAASNPLVHIVGTHHGYFPSSQAAAIADLVAQAKPDFVLVGMGQPRQELWAHRRLGQIAVPILCAGAFMDFASGRMPRAPRVVRSLRAEWMFRLVLEPRRLFGRYVGGAIPFLSRILKQRFGR